MEMKQKIGLIAFALIAFVTVGTAYQIGQTISQTVFDNQDFLSAPLNIEVTRKERIDNTIFVYFAYDSLDYNAAGDLWTVVRNETRTPYHIDKYIACRMAGNLKAECVATARAEVKADIIHFRQNIREWLETQKSKEFAEEITIDDIDIPTGELN